MGLGSMRRNAIPSTILTKQNDDVIGPRKGEVAGRRLSLLDCHNSAIRSAPICRKDTEVLEGSASYFPSLKPDPIANRGDTARYSPMELGMVRMEVDLRGRRQERVHTRTNPRRMGIFERVNDGETFSIHRRVRITTAGSNSESKPRPRTSRPHRPHIPSTSHAPETACSNSRRRGLLIFRPWDIASQERLKQGGGSG